MTTDLLNPILARLGVGRERLTVLSAREGRAVCRVSRDDGDLVAKISAIAGDFDEEAAAMRTLAGMGIPVSDVVHVESGPPALLVSRWVEGEPISATSSPGVLRKAGQILRRIHAVPAAGPYSSHPTIESWIVHWYGLVMAWWTGRGGLDAGARDMADGWLAEARPVLAGRRGCLMLFDGRPDHFLVRPDGEVGLIDVADLQAGEAAMDLAVLDLDAPGMLGGVLDGYGATVPEREAFDVLVPFLVFLRALSGAEWQERVPGDEAVSRDYLDRARAALEAHAARR